MNHERPNKGTDTDDGIYDRVCREIKNKNTTKWSLIFLRSVIQELLPEERKAIEEAFNDTEHIDFEDYFTEKYGQ